MKKKRGPDWFDNRANRQHRLHKELFWCNACKEFLTRDKYYYSANSSYQISAICSQCNKKKSKIRREKYGDKHRDYQNKKYHENSKDEIKRKHINEIARKAAKKAKDNLTDSYVKYRLKYEGYDVITPELIELKRMQLRMKRTLKEFKQWREDNESNHVDVHGEQ